MPENAIEKSVQINGLDWDQWRNAYPTLTYAEQQAFHTLIYQSFPTQQHFSAEHVARAIEDVQPHTVVELGGWDGELAEQMLDAYPIRTWVNAEICREASEAGKGRHPRYFAADMGDYYWADQWTCDLFIASHTIEHLSAEHLKQTIEATNTQAFFLDAPLLDGPQTWQGFTGSHILNIGWHGVTQILNEHGYTLQWQDTHEIDPSSGGWSRACLYAR